MAEDPRTLACTDPIAVLTALKTRCVMTLLLPSLTELDARRFVDDLVLAASLHAALHCLNDAEGL